MERTYQIDPQALERIKAALQGQVRVLSYLLPAAAALIGIALGLLGLIKWLAIGFSFALLLLLQLLLLHNYLRIQEESWQSLRIIVGPEGLRREEAGRIPVALRPEEIERLIDVEDGPLVIHYKGGRRTLAVPRELESFHLVRAQLLAWLQQEG